MRLIYEKSGEPVKIGDEVELRDGEWIVVGTMRPLSPPSTGRVILHKYGNYAQEASFYPSVIGAVWDECPTCAEPEPEEPSHYDAKPASGQLRTALHYLREYRVSPLALYAYATALDIIKEAEDAEDAELPMDPVDLCEQNLQSDLEDGSGWHIDFWSTVRGMVEQIQEDTGHEQ